MSGSFARLDDRVTVSGQISLADLMALKAAGVTLIVNNRLDHEDPGQPDSDQVARSAGDLGLAYQHMPIHGAPREQDIATLAGLLDGADGDIHLYCRSGFRSAAAWALAVTSRGWMTVDEAVAAAGSAGYDLSGRL